MSFRSPSCQFLHKCTYSYIYIYRIKISPPIQGLYHEPCRMAWPILYRSTPTWPSPRLSFGQPSAPTSSPAETGLAVEFLAVAQLHRWKGWSQVVAVAGQRSKATRPGGVVTSPWLEPQKMGQKILCWGVKHGKDQDFKVRTQNMSSFIIILTLHGSYNPVILLL